MRYGTRRYRNSPYSSVVQIGTALPPTLVTIFFAMLNCRHLLICCDFRLFPLIVGSDHINPVDTITSERIYFFLVSFLFSLAR